MNNIQDTWKTTVEKQMETSGEMAKKFFEILKLERGNNSSLLKVIFSAPVRGNENKFIPGHCSISFLSGSVACAELQNTF
jgi:hypothetical protein